MFKLIKNVNVYAPQALGLVDILIAGHKIVQIEPQINLTGIPFASIDAQGKSMTPGLIDQHIHFTGGGGEAGPASRVPEITLSEFAKAGVTTGIGLVGTDNLSRSVETLVAKTQALNSEGITAFCHTGGYRYPSPNLTGDLMKDIMFVHEIIGIKTALSDHRASHLTLDELVRLASEVRVGGMLSGKGGILVIHMGDGKDGFDLILKALETSDVPAKHFCPTHVNRKEALCLQGIELNKRGVFLDLTAYPDDKIGYANAYQALVFYREQGADLDRITISSDANGSMPVFNEQGEMIKLSAGRLLCHEQFKLLIQKAGLSVSEALPFFTSNVAKVLSLDTYKGQIAVGFDADLVLWDDQWVITDTIAKGQFLLQDRITVKKGTFE